MIPSEGDAIHRQEIARLTREQSADDTHHVDRERYAGNRTLSLDAMGEGDYDRWLSGYDGMKEEQSAGGAGDGPHIIGHHRPKELTLTSGFEQRPDETAREHVLIAAVESMTPAQREVFHLYYGERIPQREIARRLGIARTSVQDRLETIKRIVLRALIEAAEEGS